MLKGHRSILTVRVLKWLYFYGSRVRVLLLPLMLEPFDGSWLAVESSCWIYEHALFLLRFELWPLSVQHYIIWWLLSRPLLHILCFNLASLIRNQLLLRKYVFVGLTETVLIVRILYFRVVTQFFRVFNRKIRHSQRLNQSWRWEVSFLRALRSQDEVPLFNHLGVCEVVWSLLLVWVGERFPWLNVVEGRSGDEFAYWRYFRQSVLLVRCAKRVLGYVLLSMSIEFIFHDSNMCLSFLSGPLLSWDQEVEDIILYFIAGILRVVSCMVLRMLRLVRSCGVLPCANFRSVRVALTLSRSVQFASFLGKV